MLNKTMGTCKSLKGLNEECLLEQSKRLERNVAYDCPCGKGYKCTKVSKAEVRTHLIGKRKLKPGKGLCKPAFCIDTNDCGQTQCCVRLFGVKMPYLSKVPRPDAHAIGKCRELSKERQGCFVGRHLKDGSQVYNGVCPCLGHLDCRPRGFFVFGASVERSSNVLGLCRPNICTKQKDCEKDECCVLDKEDYNKTGIIPEFGRCRQLGKCGEACVVGTNKPPMETKPMFIDCPCKDQQYTCRPLHPSNNGTLVIGGPGTCQKWNEEEREVRRLGEEERRFRMSLNISLNDWNYLRSSLNISSRAHFTGSSSGAKDRWDRFMHSLNITKHAWDVFKKSLNVTKYAWENFNKKSNMLHDSQQTNITNTTLNIP
ncbi:unnamed protein product [Owenia fusiformis]|uniref:Uncharacterized protein n=1 Tax=Owenia fusiformis TaxID=6347 RepID=A0A8S4NJM1_OWEFU|nr:unnamed protein product [Owenia fusiformis]